MSPAPPPSAAPAPSSSTVTAKTIFAATRGDTDYILREITMRPGGSTGWHYHDGTLYALVRSGTLTHADHAGVDVYRAGQRFVEPSGADNVHIARNLDSAPVVMDVLYVDPAGSPLSHPCA